MSIIGTIYEDVTTDVLGKIGPWQWLITVLCTALMVPTIFDLYEDMFLLRRPTEIQCIPPEQYKVINTTLCFITLVRNNTEKLKCKKWYVKLMWLIWLKKSWLLYCDHDLQLLSTTMICRLGFIFGCVIYGFISDSFGRRRTMIASVFSELLMRCILTFCDSEGWFRLFVFLRSLLGSGNLYMGLILVCEIASNTWRSWLCLIVSSPRLIALVCMVPISNALPNSETLCLIACLYSAFLIVITKWIPESPHWLLFNRKISLAEKIIIKAAKKNGVVLCNDFKIRPVNHTAYNTLDEIATCIGMLTVYNIRVVTLVSLLVWSLYNFLWTCLYIKVYSEEMLSDLILKIFCFIGVFGCLTILLSLKITMKYLLVYNIIITGTFAVITLTFNQLKGTIGNHVSSMAIASGVISHTLLLIITPRIFAMHVRATLLGFCHATGQFGSIIGHIIVIQVANPQALVAITAVVTICIIALCFILPDVDGRELPDVMEDMDYFSELSKPLRWATQKTNSPSYEEVEMRVYSFGSAGRNLSAQHPSSLERIPAQRIRLCYLWSLCVNAIHHIYTYCTKDPNTVL